ncbi:glycoside hydrolase family 3 protein [Maribacter aestuarii]|uniref:glycoside hydrolase family 3 protein n=1 Tax=Maribacter aestuarii TaxID=1130723 RepID=UPI00248C4C23|nr:glycoside hydrolase family 3 protein [Maribacter aestuarii]
MSKVFDYNIAKDRLSLKEKLGQLFMPAAFINDSEEEILRLERLIQEQQIGGLCFFHSRASAATNYEGNQQVVYNESSFDTLTSLIERYQAVAKYPLIIAIDAEWGLAMRIENTPQYPYAITLGAIDDAELIFQVGKQIALDCKAAGIHWNLSPVVDININPNNPVIGYRSFGENRELVTKNAIAYVSGTESEGILTSIKHFPGHGDTATDSHLGLPLIDKSKEELLQNELYPFQKLIDKGVDAIMVGHLSVPALADGKRIPSSISEEIIKGTLRKEMGFKGVIISDALNMHAVSKNYPLPGELEWLAFNAGNDVLCFSEHVQEGIETILRNASQEQIEESFERVWKLKVKAFNEHDTSAELDFNKAGALNRKIAEKGITLLKGHDSDIANFRDTDYCTLFLKRFDEHQEQVKILKAVKRMKSEIRDEKQILLLLTPPQMKPTNSFGFLKEEINFINDMINTKQVVLYHYGNPYALQLFNYEDTLATVVVYQDMKEFQDVATAHFLGQFKAKGKMPVTIKSLYHEKL